MSLLLKYTLLCVGIFLTLLIQRTLTIVCAQCRVSPDGVCKSDSDHKSSLVDCKHGQVCGAILMKLVDRTSNPNVMLEMSFGTNEKEVTFKGCVNKDYCWQPKPYILVGAERIRCHTCDRDKCNVNISFIKYKLAYVD